MSRMLKKASEYEGDVDKALSSCGVGKALGGINDSSRAGRPPLRKRVIERDKTEEGEGRWSMRNEKRPT